MAVSHWESGKNEPSAAIFSKLAQITEGDPRNWFLRAARSKSGLSGDALGQMDQDGTGSEITPLRADRRTKNRRRNPFVEVRLISGFAGAGPAYIHETDEYDGLLSIPKDICPNPAETRCIRVKGESMEPTIADGTIAAVDGSQKKVERLTGKIVAAWHETEGVLLKRLVRVGGKLRLASDNPGYDPRDLQDGWELVGRVIWWIQKA